MHHSIPSRRMASLGLLALLAAAASSVLGQSPPPSTKLKDQIRQPWVRSNERFIRANWQVLAEVPLASSADALAQDPFATTGGEAALKPGNESSPKLADGTALKWRSVTSWGDAIDLSDGNGLKRNLAAYAANLIRRDEAGKALLCLGSDEGMRVWVNGTLVLDKHGPRPLTFDEDQIEVDLKAGDNLLLLKVEQRTGPWSFSARVLERGAIPSRMQEIAPSFTVEGTTLIVKTDLNADHAAEEKVTVQAIAAGGKVLAEKTATRGERVRIDAIKWTDGAYELRCTTRQPDGLRYATHLAWYKGDAITAARELVTAGAKADVTTPSGQTVKMLADMVLDRLGKDGLAITGNPWWAIHSPLMEYAELKLEATGDKAARTHAGGFYRLAWRDDVDGSPQYARAYLPVGYDPAKKTPLVIKLHGYNPPNPEYVRWWAADSRHSLADVEYGKGEGIIYLEPHGRGNTQYLGLGDADVLRAIAEAKAHFNIDEDRIYLTGDSMGGWGTWNVGSRHPDVFAALAPIYGGVDYHSYLTEEQLAALNPLTRFMQEKNSTQAFADGLLNMPVMVLHGDVDRSVNVDWSRYNVRMLQRWGYNVRYVELPGYGHEDINRWPFIFSWFLEHRREAQPRHVRLRSAELQNASAYWVAVETPDRSDRFMLVDAEVVGSNTIRLDTQNISALTLSPGPKLIDPAQSVKVVWNGDGQTISLNDGKIRLRAAGLVTPVLAKNSRIAGPIGDILNTPFAIVTGTASADPAMNEVCRQKTDTLVAMWQDWQRQPPRVFKDSELSEADAVKYSLILIGGPDANLVTRKLADRLPLKLTKDTVTIGNRSFAATDARMQMIRPNPLNPQRYVVVVAAVSAASLRLWAPATLRAAQFDFTIEDSHVAGLGQQSDHTDFWVAGGWFDRDWAWDDALVHPGNIEARAKSLVLHGDLEAALLEPYVGRYEIAPGMAVTVTRTGSHLSAKVGEQPAMDMIPAGEDTFYFAEGPAIVVFAKDAMGRAISFNSSQQNGRDFSAKRID